MFRTYTWLLPSWVAIALACAGPAETPAPQPAQPVPAATGSWELEGLTLTFDPEVGFTPAEAGGSGDLNMKVLGKGTLTGGATVEVRTWQPPFQDAPTDDPFGQTAEEAKKSVGAYVRACRDGATDHLVKQTRDPQAGTFDELAVRGMMWDAEDYSVLLHHLWTFRTPSDLCAVAWIGTHGQEIFFDPRLHVLVGRGDERFVVLVTQELKDSTLFAELEDKPLQEQFAQGAVLAKTAWESPAVSTARKLVDTLAKK
jgi:hypothetical protein